MSLGNFNCTLDSFPASYSLTSDQNIGIDNCTAVTNNAPVTSPIGGGGMSGTCSIIPITKMASIDLRNPVCFLIISTNFSASSANSLSDFIPLPQFLIHKTMFAAFPDQNNSASANVRVIPIFDSGPDYNVIGFRFANTGTTGSTYIAFLCFGI
jgi:hypothetical protein